jgi:predicted phosphate transport protein (TIGR00153 family)
MVSRRSTWARTRLHRLFTSQRVNMPRLWRMGGPFTLRARSAANGLAGEHVAGRLGRMVGRRPDYGDLYDLLGRAGRNVELSTALLRELMRSWPDGAEKRLELIDVEHANDAVTHDIVHHLHARLAVPFERSDVLALASGLDDVVDFAEEVADYLGLYKVEAPMDQAIELADTLAAAGSEVALALGALDGRPDLAEAHRHLAEIDRLEDEGDRILRAGLTALFDGGVDPMAVIRWKDIFERVEDAIDACDSVAHTLRGIAVKRT